jgi:uncharacterized membrane protein (UPF0127 family)
VCARAILARTFLDRSLGLLQKSELPDDEGMLFEAERLVPLMWMHTMFMRFPIDIVFLNQDNLVVKIEASLKPWRVSAIAFGARKALEVAAGTSIRTRTSVGDIISIV